mmetsp:Transcript_34849/g.107584  ORF Transcript_34849/g.107584 Transcript_34849/m.107584 type:complete len:248 (-) Transcript_34849:95-838(-)
MPSRSLASCCDVASRCSMHWSSKTCRTAYISSMCRTNAAAVASIFLRSAGSSTSRIVSRPASCSSFRAYHRTRYASTRLRSAIIFSRTASRSDCSGSSRMRGRARMCSCSTADRSNMCSHASCSSACRRAYEASCSLFVFAMPLYKSSMVLRKKTSMAAISSDASLYSRMTPSRAFASSADTRRDTSTRRRSYSSTANRLRSAVRSAMIASRPAASFFHNAKNSSCCFSSCFFSVRRRKKKLSDSLS